MSGRPAIDIQDGGSSSPRIAVWGLGRMGLRHAENVQRSSYAQLAGVADIDPERSGSAASQLQVPAYGDLRELLAQLRPDGVVIATHASNHAEAIEIAAGHDVHIFCEKPLAFDGPSAVRVLAAAKDAGVHLQMGFQMRFDDDLRRLATEVRGGALGQVFQLRSSLLDVASPPRAYLELSGGYFRDAAVHCLDYGRWLLGEVEEVLAVGAALSDPMYAELGDVDNAAILVRFVSGALGMINLCRVAAYGFDSSVEVLGERGALRAPGGRIDGLQRFEPGRVAWTHAQDFLERFAGAYASEMDAFARLLAGEIDQSASTGEDGLAAMRIAEASARSAQRRAAVQIAEVEW